MSKLILGIGLPGSGKTTALKPFAEKNGYIYISPGDIREELSVVPCTQKHC
jgi:predicted kinase